MCFKQIISLNVILLFIIDECEMVLIVLRKFGGAQWSMGHMLVQPCCKTVESCSLQLFDSYASTVQYLAMNEASHGRIGA